jgi:putative ABC transport system permease protein
MLRWLARLRFVGRTLIRPKGVEDELNKELQYHLEREIHEGLRAGLTPEEARYAAMRTMGAVEKSKEECRDEHHVKFVQGVEAFFRNIRYSIRTLLRTPGFTLTVVLTLALGTGANTAVFSAINAVLLRPLPFPEADRLVQITQTQQRSSESNIAPTRLEDWNAQNSTFQAVSGYLSEDVSDTSGDIPERVRRASVAPRFFSVWGTTPAMGRGFTAADHQPGAPPVVVVSDRYWRSRLNADPKALGKEVRIGATSFSIVGVMPASFRFPDRNVDLWFPRIYDQSTTNRRGTWYIGIGRLKPGFTVDQARADLGVVQTQLARQYPDTDRDIGARILPLKEAVVANTGESLWFLFGAVSLLLLISCINIAALLLSRAAHRDREIAVRLSIGASRFDVVGQMLTEAAILAVTGTLLGLAISAGGSAAFRQLAPNMPRIDEIALDGRILLYTLAIMATVTFLCGAFPALRGTRGSLAGTLAESGRTQVASRQRLQWLMVGIQVALSVTLLGGAGLLLRSLQELSRVNLGFQPQRVLAFRMSSHWDEVRNLPRLMQQIERVVDGLRTVPGVDAAATSVTPPGVPMAFEQEFRLVEDHDDRDSSTRSISAGSTVVSPGYFATLDIPVSSGEVCRVATDAAFPELMVNASFAERYLSGYSAVGLHLTSPGAPANVPPPRIVGVVADARERGIDRPAVPTVYLCGHPAQPFRVFLVRTRGEPTAIAQAVRLKVKELEPLRSIYDMAPLEESISDAFAQNRLRTVMLLSFAFTALSLACIGLYGTMSYVVSLRRREVGLRLALGALRRDIVRHFVLKGLRVIAPACAAGLALAGGSGRLLTGMLYGVSPYDPVTLSAVVVIVVFVATLASLLPAARAALVQPVRVLRDE